MISPPSLVNCFANEGKEAFFESRRKSTIFGQSKTKFLKVAEKAMDGKSTKKDQNGRGWGINTNVQIFTEGLNGEIFIAS